MLDEQINQNVNRRPLNLTEIYGQLEEYVEPVVEQPNEMVVEVEQKEEKQEQPKEEQPKEM